MAEERDVRTVKYMRASANGETVTHSPEELTLPSYASMVRPYFAYESLKAHVGMYLLHRAKNGGC